MKQEMKTILEESNRQANEFFSHSVEKLKEKEKVLINYYENKLLEVKTLILFK